MEKPFKFTNGQVSHEGVVPKLLALLSLMVPLDVHTSQQGVEVEEEARILLAPFPFGIHMLPCKPQICYRDIGREIQTPHVKV